jgi:Flp pilus assembly pilin Flp
MKLVIRKMKRFLATEGPTAEEYAVIAALFAIVCLSTFSALTS